MWFKSSTVVSHNLLNLSKIKISSMSSSTPIGTKDIVSIQGNYLVKEDGTRFLMKGIGFPISEQQGSEGGYNAKAWIAILHQLNSLELEYNTVRIYDMDPTIDYSEFMNEAAKLGVYVIVPLTGKSGDGVLDRNKVAPKCYPRELFSYGVSCLKNYLQYPNVIGGLLANEVVNTLESWPAAPCVKAYGRDLKLYMKDNMDRPLPLIYAAQHSGIGAEFSADDVMKITMDYLTCDEPAIDIFGVNIESWCSSQASFELDEDGEIGSYYSLYQSMHQSKMPLIFTEMGCSHNYFDKDNGLHDKYGARDWKQVSIVLKDMVDTWSGFCAYAYSGNPDFDMFKGGPWSNTPLKPTQDFYNFRDELHKVSHLTANAAKSTNSTVTATITEDSPQLTQSIVAHAVKKEDSIYSAKTCANVEHQLSSCDIHIKPFSKIMPYHYVSNVQAVAAHSANAIPLILAGFVGFFLIKRLRTTKKVDYVELTC